MKRYAVALVLTLTALAAFAAVPVVRGSAGGTITGTVTAAGLSTNANAVVYVEQVAGTFTPPAPVQIDQRSLKFAPEVLPVVVGTTVKFLNSDSVAHNVFSPDYEKYNLGTWPQGQFKEHVFAKCAKAPCVYTQLCLIHPEMQGFVVVLQNPYFAVTDAAGHFTINDVPPGQYKVGVWHQKLKAQSKPVVVEAGKPATVDFALGR
jgi:plastocyanin